MINVNYFHTDQMVMHHTFTPVSHFLHSTTAYEMRKMQYYTARQNRRLIMQMKRRSINSTDNYSFPVITRAVDQFGTMHNSNENPSSEFFVLLLLIYSSVYKIYLMFFIFKQLYYFLYTSFFYFTSLFNYFNTFYGL